MAAKTISIEFQGYWRDENKGGLPAESGVYCVYECTHNVNNGTVSLNKLIYVGEADNVKTRVSNHEKYNDWRKHVRIGNELCFSFGAVITLNRERAEAAMIFQHKPPENIDYLNSFPYDQTSIRLSGNTALLSSVFTVNRT